MRVDRLGHAFEVDIDAEDADGLQIVQLVLGRSGEAWSLQLELADLRDSERHDQEDQPRQHDDDAYENDHDRQHARHSGGVETDDGRLDQEGDRRAEDERAQKVAKQEEDHDGHDQSPHAERDLQVATAPLRIENP